MIGLCLLWCPTRTGTPLSSEAFDMIVASELNLGPIAIQAFESHHRSEDWAIFISKLIEQADNIFKNKDVVIF